MINRILNIIYAYFHWLTYKLFHKRNTLYMHRYNLCQKCDLNKFGICDICKCILAIKTTVDFDLDENGLSIDGCPTHKW